MNSLRRYIYRRYRLARLSSRQRRLYAWYQVSSDRAGSVVLVMDRECRPRGVYEVYRN